VREETGLRVKGIVYQGMFDRPERGAITVLFSVSVERQAARMQFPGAEIADLGFFDLLPANTTPSAKFFWKRENSQRGTRR